MDAAKDTTEADQLFEAARSGDVEKVREILECGKCTVNCTDSVGWTPLHWACLKGHVDVVRVLVSEFKANMTIQTLFGGKGYTALHYSCREGHVDIVRTLVKYKANVNAKTDSGDTQLTLAARHGHSNIVHAFLSD